MIESIQENGVTDYEVDARTQGFIHKTGFCIARR